MPKSHIDDHLARLAKYHPVCNTWAIRHIFVTYDSVSVSLRLRYGPTTFCVRFNTRFMVLREEHSRMMRTVDVFVRYYAVLTTITCTIPPRIITFQAVSATNVTFSLRMTPYLIRIAKYDQVLPSLLTIQADHIYVHLTTAHISSRFTRQLLLHYN